MFFNEFYLTQILHAINLCYKDFYGVEHEWIPSVIQTESDEYSGNNLFLLLKSHKLMGITTAYILESDSIDAESVIKDHGITDEIICMDPTPITEEEEIDGLIIILDQSKPYFVSNRQLRIQ